MKDGKVYINGSDTPLDEPYLPEPMEGSYGPYEVPEGCYFMMGDNRNNSWMPVSGIINSLPRTRSWQKYCSVIIHLTG